MGHSLPKYRGAFDPKLPPEIGKRENAPTCGKCFVIRSKKDPSKVALVMGVDNSGELSNPWSMEISNAAMAAMGGQQTPFEWAEIKPGYPGCQN